MATAVSYAEGFIFSRMTIPQLAAVFSSAGYDTNIGTWALRVKTPMCVKFGYVGNLTPDEPFEIEIDGYGVPIDEAVSCCNEIAEVLCASGVQFEFTHIDGAEKDIAFYENKKHSEQDAAPNR